VSPSTVNGRFASPEFVMGDAEKPPRAAVKDCRLDVCRKKSVLRGMRWRKSSETRAGEGEEAARVGRRVRMRVRRE
jgi:hypothetical protein